MQSLRDRLSAQLNLFSFNTEHFNLPVSYDPKVIYPVGADRRSDIETLLDGMVLQFDMIHMPERHAVRWQIFRHTNSSQVIHQIIGYREKFGLPLV
jgi:hypothetical protein